MSAQDIYQVTLLVVRIFEQLGVAYEIGGSLASSIHGKPRSTLGADIVADLNASQVDAFVSALGGDFYADAQAFRNAVQLKKSINVIHLPTMLKVQIIPLRASNFAKTRFLRRIQAKLGDSCVWISSAEDLILHEIKRYWELGEKGRDSLDGALGILRISGTQLDLEYLQKWSKELDIEEVFNRTLNGVPTGRIE